MGDVIQFGPYLAARQAKKLAASQPIDLSTKAFDLLCQDEGVDPDTVFEIMQHEDCDVGAALMAAGAKKRAD